MNQSYSLSLTSVIQMIPKINSVGDGLPEINDEHGHVSYLFQKLFYFILGLELLSCTFMFHLIRVVIDGHFTIKLKYIKCFLPGK